VKATVPRFRYDQLMRLGWKIFLPISLIWVFLVSGWLLLTREQCPAAGGYQTEQAAERYHPSCSVRTTSIRHAGGTG
jgi:NADH-quinone oxidoreductase subunit H